MFATNYFKRIVEHWPATIDYLTGANLAETVAARDKEMFKMASECEESLEVFKVGK